MKYVVSWISKAGLGEKDAERSLAVFAKWSPLPTAAFSEFLGRVDAAVTIRSAWVRSARA